MFIFPRNTSSEAHRRGLFGEITQILTFALAVHRGFKTPVWAFPGTWIPTQDTLKQEHS